MTIRLFATVSPPFHGRDFFAPFGGASNGVTQNRYTVKTLNWGRDSGLAIHEFDRSLNVVRHLLPTDAEVPLRK